MLGHSSAALTLDRYGHLMPGQAEAVAARLDQLARDARPATSIERPTAMDTSLVLHRPALEAFIGCADSGAPDWASRDIHELRSEGPATRR